MRLRSLTLGEYLCVLYGWYVERIHEPKERNKFDRSLLPTELVVSDGGRWLPPELQDERPPDWWTG